MSQLLNHAVTQIDTEVKREYQYEGKLMYDMFFTKTGNAKTFEFNKQGQAYSSKHIPNAPLVLDQINRSKERVIIDFYDINSFVDSVEELLVNYSARQAVIDECKTAAGRRKDDVILKAITNFSPLSNNIVAKNYSGSAEGLTVAKIKALAAMMDANNVPEEGRVLFVHPNQLHNSLTNDIKVTSKDFTKAEALDNGTINQYYGFRFVKIPNFQVVEGIDSGIPKDTVAGTTYCYAMCTGKKNSPIGVGVNTDISFKTGEIAERGFSFLVHGKLGIGAEVIESKGIFRADCSIV